MFALPEYNNPLRIYVLWCFSLILQYLSQYIPFETKPQYKHRERLKSHRGIVKHIEKNNMANHGKRGIWGNHEKIAK